MQLHLLPMLCCEPAVLHVPKASAATVLAVYGNGVPLMAVREVHTNLRPGLRHAVCHAPGRRAPGVRMGRLPALSVYVQPYVHCLLLVPFHFAGEGGPRYIPIRLLRPHDAALPAQLVAELQHASLQLRPLLEDVTLLPPVPRAVPDLMVPPGLHLVI